MSKIPAQDKINYCKQYVDGKMTQGQIAGLTNVDKASVRKWIMKYESMGETAFLGKGWKKYTKEIKVQAVKDYIAGFDSMMGICKKYGIHSPTQLSKWILKYNGHEELRASGTGGDSIMTKGRKTSFDDRVEIVQYCIAHEHNYAQTAEKYQVSYQQARNYTVKYESDGVEALRDNRGKRKVEDKMTELEHLRAENKILRAEKKRAEMEVSFLKKLKDIERRRG